MCGELEVFEPKRKSQPNGQPSGRCWESVATIGTVYLCVREEKATNGWISTGYVTESVRNFTMPSTMRTLKVRQSEGVCGFRWLWTSERMPKITSLNFTQCSYPDRMSWWEQNWRSLAAKTLPHLSFSVLSSSFRSTEHQAISLFARWSNFAVDSVLAQLEERLMFPCDIRNALHIIELTEWIWR